MKKILFFLAIIFPGVGISQIVSDQTNIVSLDLNRNIRTVLPEIEWIYPGLEYTNSQENRINIRADITSQVPLKAVTLKLMDSKDAEKVRGTRDIDLEESRYNISIDQDIYLMDGKNWIQIMVETEEGGIVYDYRSVLVGLDAISDAVAIDRKDYALLFATDKYDNWSDLVNPIYDAQSIAKELEERYGFQVEIIQNADNDEVMTKLRDYSEIKYKPQDQLFIFFAGHGQYDDVFGEGYVVARNSIQNDPSKNSYISHNRIRGNINNSPCEHIFLVMDVCFGGTFDPELAASRGISEDANDREYLVKKLSKKTRKYLTSGSKEYVSDGVVGQHSPFALKFIEALKSNGEEDRILILDEIRLYMERLKTTPRFDGFGNDEKGSDFVFVAK